jgi:hypothetical protein
VFNPGAIAWTGVASAINIIAWYLMQLVTDRRTVQRLPPVRGGDRPRRARR